MQRTPAWRPGFGMNGSWGWLIFFLSLVATFASNANSARSPAVDPSTGRIRIIYLGDAWGISSPYQHMALDPSFMVTPVPASSGHMGGMVNMSRYIRLYVPRTYDALVASQDVIILSDTVRSYYQASHITWFRDSVLQGGKGIIMVGGREIQWGDWWNSPVEEALPVHWVPQQTFEGMPFKAVPTSASSPFLASLPWKTMPAFLGMNLANAKEGSQTLLEVEDKGYPVLVFGEQGNGAGVAHTPDWTPAWGSLVFSQWPYFADYVANILYLAAGAKIPSDPDLMHRIRENLFQVSIRWGIVSGLSDFVDRFGANVHPLEQALAEVEALRTQASKLYLKQEYEQVLAVVAQTEEKLFAAMDLAGKIKNRALLWIYITEGAALTGTSILCAVAVWFLMVKRKLYREVGSTRQTA